MAARDVHVLRESAGEGAGRRPGAQLRRARERRGMSAADVAAGLHLDLRTVSAVERDAWDELPPATFARGYYRAYARFMELPEEGVLAALDGNGLEGERRPLQARVGELAGSRRGSWFPGAMLVLLAAGVIGSTLWYRQQLQSYEAEGGPPAVAGPPASEPSDAGAGDSTAGSSSGVPAGGSGPPTVAGPKAATPSPEPVSPSAGAPAISDPLPSAGARAPTDPSESPQPAATDVDRRIPGVSAATGPPAAAQAPVPDAGDRITPQRGPATDTSGSEPSSDEPSAEVEAPAASPSVASETAPTASGEDPEPAGARSPPPAAEPVRSAPLATQSLELRLAGPSWVEVVDARGERLIYGLLSGGSRRGVAGVPPISVVIGDAAVAELRYRGDPLPLQDHTQGKVARLTLGQERTR